jgi:hypothetical protein
MYNRINGIMGTTWQGDMADDLKISNVPTMSLQAMPST